MGHLYVLKIKAFIKFTFIMGEAQFFLNFLQFKQFLCLLLFVLLQIETCTCSSSYFILYVTEFIG